MGKGGGGGIGRGGFDLSGESFALPFLSAEPAVAAVLRWRFDVQVAEDFGLVGGRSPRWDAVGRRVEEVRDLFGIFETGHVNGDGGEDPKDSIEKNPATESSFLKIGIGNIDGLFVSGEAFDHGATCG